MSNRSILILSFVTLIIIVAATISSQKRVPITELERVVLLPVLKDRINDIATITIESRDQSLQMSKQSDGWVVEHADNYSANFSKVRLLVLAIAELYIVSERTRTPSLFAELGVEDPKTGNSNSRLLTFKDKAGNVITSLILGNTAQGNIPGQYVRKAGGSETWLVSNIFDLPVIANDWIETSLLNISNDRIMETIIAHPDGTLITLFREQGAKNFSIRDVPEGKQARSFYFTNQPPTFLSDLSIQNVRTQAAFEFPESAIRTTFKTYDGLIATITSTQTDLINYIAVAFSVDETLIAQAEAAEAGAPIMIGDQPVKIDVRQEVMDLNSRVAGWVYTIPNAKYLLLAKSAEELMDDI